MQNVLVNNYERLVGCGQKVNRVYSILIDRSGHGLVKACAFCLEKILLDEKASAHDGLEMLKVESVQKREKMNGGNLLMIFLKPLKPSRPIADALKRSLASGHTKIVFSTKQVVQSVFLNFRKPWEEITLLLARQTNLV